MVQLWRLTRNRYGRAIYDALDGVGITATVMYEYVAKLADYEDSSRTAANGYTIEVCEPARVGGLDAPVHELEPGEEIVAAIENGSPRGYLFLSIDSDHEIRPLERTLSFEGAYIRRVFVDSTHRNRGIATAMIAAACDRSYERGARRATALVALDNHPSRTLFEQRGFEPRRVRRYVRLGPVAHRRVRST